MAELTTLGGPIAAALEALPSGQRLSYAALDDTPAPPVSSVNGRTGNVVIGPADVGSPTAAVVQDLRAVSGSGYKTPTNELSLDTLVSQLNVSGAVQLSPADPANGFRNLFMTVAGPTVINAVIGLPYMTGTIRIRMLGVFTVTWGATIRRSGSDTEMQPDVRPWKDTLYGFEVVDGRMRVFLHESFDGVLDTPTFGTYGAAYDAGAGVARETDNAGTLSSIGSPVRYLPPVAQNFSYLQSNGAAGTDTIAGFALDTASGDAAPASLVDVGGRVGIQTNGSGVGLEATLTGAQGLGNPNPAGTPDAMPYYTRVTLMASVFIPTSAFVPGTLMGMVRADTSQTARMFTRVASDGILTGYGRFSQGAVPQIGSAAEVAANTAVNAMTLEGSAGRWMLFAKQIRITSINTTEDTAPPGTAVRGTGATWETWLDNFQGTFGRNQSRNFSSYRGTNGFRPNRLVIGAGRNAAVAAEPTNAIFNRLIWTFSPTLAYGNAEWNRLAGWVKGV